MKQKILIVLFLIAAMVALVQGLSDQAHEFLQSECGMCHIDEKNDPQNLIPFYSSACDNCHSDVKRTQSHPTNVYATLQVPQDMPLTEGRITCATCHYVHPKKGKQLVERHYFLRRLVRGPLFCSICHEIDEKGHLVVGSAHSGTYKETDRGSSIDRTSLSCIECHDRYYQDPGDFLGAGTWEHSSKMSHPIGIDYDRAALKKLKDFRPMVMLRKELEFFDGKLGCGTCHNIYSQNRNMLVIDNYRSRLCRECHLK